jgi:hypothetical protein
VPEHLDRHIQFNQLLNLDHRRILTDDTMVIRIPIERKARIDEELASGLFQIEKPLSIFDDDCWIQFLVRNFEYTPPKSQIISTHLSSLSSSFFLCLVMDESTNVNANRIINTSTVKNSGDSFHWPNVISCLLQRHVCMMFLCLLCYRDSPHEIRSSPQPRPLHYESSCKQHTK